MVDPIKEKKASEVLAEISLVQSEILGYIKNINLTNKIIISKLQEMGSFSTKPTPGTPPTVGIPSFDFPPAQQTTQGKTQLQLALEQDAQEQEDDEALLVEMNPHGKQRTQRHMDVTKKIPVEQHIVYADGKNIYMANVEIYNNVGEKVKQTRTNQVGKWLAGLAVGTYTVNITKAGTALKPKVELQYTIDVPNSDSKVELEMKKSQL